MAGEQTEFSALSGGREDASGGWPRRLARMVAAAARALGPAPAAASGRLALTVTLDRDGVRSASAPARAMLGDAVRRGAPLHVLRAALSDGDADLCAAFDALIARGRAFSRRAPIAGRGVFEVSGGPSGGTCVLQLRDVTAETEAQAARDAAAGAAKAETAALRAALDAAGAAVWRLDAQGAVTWASAGAQRATPPATGAGGALRIADGAGALVVATAAGPVGVDGAVLNRFIETVTETFVHLRIGLAIYDRDRRLTLANPAVSEIFGLDAPFIGQRPTLRQTLDRMREARQLPEQLDFPAWRATLFTLFDDPARANYDERWELPDGRSIHVIGRPHPTGGVAFVFEDVTEAISAQRWRLTAVEVRRAMLDALGDGVIAFGPDGKTRMANPALLEIWGFGPGADAAPRHVAEFSAACRDLIADVQIWDLVRDAVSRAAPEGPRRVRVRLVDGRVLAARIAQMPDGSTLAAFSDVSDGERAADALRDRAVTLEAAEQMRTAMLYQISHRLRTPLNAVIGFAGLLAEGHAGPVHQPQASYLDNIRDASTALLEGVESLAELVASGAPSVDVEADEVGVGAVLRGALELLESRLAERGLKVEVAPEAEAAIARGDPPRLRQMIYAALAEAVAAAAPGETLGIGAAAQDGKLEIWCAAPSLGAGRSSGFGVARRTAEMHGGLLFFDAPADGPPRIACRIAGALGEVAVAPRRGAAGRPPAGAGRRRAAGARAAQTAASPASGAPEAEAAAPRGSAASAPGPQAPAHGGAAAHDADAEAPGGLAKSAPGADAPA